MLTNWKYQLDDIRTRARILNLWQGLAHAFVALVGGLALSALAVGIVPAPGPKLLLVVLAPLCALVLFYAKGIRPVRRLTPHRVAATIEHRCVQLGGRLISAVEIETALKESPDAFPYSPELAEAFLSTVDGDLPSIDATQVYPSKPFAQALLKLAGAVFACALVLMLRPDALSMIFAPPATAATVAPPRAVALGIRAFKITYEFPAYSGLDKQTVTNAGGNVLALKGTEVGLTVEFDADVRAASILLPGGERVPMRLVSARTAAATLVLTSEGKYHIEATTGKGEVAVLPEYDMSIQPDALPTVGITSMSPGLSPDHAIEIEPAGLIEIGFRCSDDYGLSAARLAVQTGPSEKPRFVARMRLEDRTADKMFSWKVPDEFARLPEPAFVLWVEVDDNDNVSGPKTGTSRKIRVQLITAETRHEQSIALQRMLLGRMVELLGDNLEIKLSPKVHEFRAAQRIISARIGNTIQLGDACAQYLKDDPLADLNVYKVITEMTSHRQDALTRRRALYQAPVESPPGGPAAGPPRLTPDWLNSWARDDALEIKVLETDILLLDKYIKSQEMALISALGKRIADSRKRLEELLAQLKKDGASAALNEEIRKEIATLQRRIAEMAARMRRLAEDLPSEFVNRDALPTAKADEMRELEDKIQKALAEGRQEDALKLAAELAQRLGKSLDTMQENMQRWASQSFSKDLQKMRDLQKSIAQLEREQNRLVNKTTALRDQHQKKVVDQMKDMIDGEVAKIRKQVKEADALTQKLDEATRKTKAPPIEGLPPGPDLRELEKQWQQLDKQLERKQLFEASRSADGARSSYMQWLQDRLRRQMMRDRMQRTHANEGPGDLPQEAPKLKRKTDDINRAIEDLLKRLRQSADRSASAADGKQMSEMSQRQGKLRDQSRRVRQQARQASGEGQNEGNGLQQSLQGAEKSMEGAEKNLNGKQLSGALDDERKALEQLSETNKKLSERIQQMGDAARMQRRPMSMSAGSRREDGRMGTSQRRVDIPDADSYKPSGKFRDDIMRIISNGLPEAYQKANEEYYRSLVE